MRPIARFHRPPLLEWAAGCPADRLGREIGPDPVREEADYAAEADDADAVQKDDLRPAGAIAVPVCHQMDA